MPTNVLIENDGIVSALRDAIKEGDMGLRHVPALLKRVLQEERWKERVVRQTGEIVRFERFEQFITTTPPEGMGATMDLIHKIVRDDPEAENLLDQATAKGPGAPLGNKNAAEEKTMFDIIKDCSQADEPPTGDTRNYALRRLRKERPDLLQKVIDKELSPHAAMVEGGFREQRISIPIDPRRAANSIKRYFDADQVEDLIDLLSE